MGMTGSSVLDVLAERRHQLTLRTLRSGGPAAVTDLSKRLGVSPATIRRDLAKLEEEGLLTPVHGGAAVGEDDWLFLGTSGIRPHSHAMDDTVVEVPVKRAMIAAADSVVLLADAGTFPGTGTARVCGPEALGTMVTNAPADPVTGAALNEAGVKVVEV
jgi:DeoR/GlpR family transcriptional regulator of sugar metabolism